MGEVVYRKDVVDICFPGKLLTYWACSTPVVAVVDENSETAIQIKMGDSGIITPPEDVDALYQAILKLAGSPKLRKSIGKRGRKTILERFEKYKVLDAFHNQLVKTMEMKK